MEQSKISHFSLPEGRGSGKHQLESLRTAFIRNVSHELRTPLHLVHGYAELLRNGDLGQLAPEQEEAILVIADRAQELRTLVERIGVLLAVEGETAATQRLELDEVVSKVVDRQRPAAEAGDLKLELDMEAGLPSTLGDPYHLEQAVACLVENAIKFTQAGGRVDVAVCAGPNWVSVSVADTGIGIPEGELEHIFSGFYQVDGSATRRYEGIGLGLTVVRAVAEEHDAQIEVESEPGRGSRFVFKLPVISSDTEVEKSVQGGPVVQRILIVDDEEFVALTLQEGLDSLPNCETVVAANGEEALRYFEQKPFDVLITDYRMPGTDGITLAGRIREMYPRTVIIMITAYGNEALREQAAHASIERIMDKPVQLSDIRHVALEALGRSEDRSEPD